jgi:uncharacterized membrane protein/predicted DsbA family dithiol-disulfide isomerase
MLSPRQAPFVRTAALLVPIAAGLAASSMLLVDYVRPMPVFCDDGGGCDALKHTTIAHAFGVPTPAIGIAGFVVLAALALARGTWARRALAVASTLGAVVALFLIGVQMHFDVYCAFCMTVDTSTVVLAGVAAYRWRAGWDIPPSTPLLTGAAAVWLLAILTPFTIGKFHRDILPAGIEAELATTPPGKVTVVDFVDYECPFCRLNNDDFAPLLAANREKIRLVRKNVPLRMHPHAMDAARAACCGARLGKEDAMSDALFAAPVEDLTPDGCEKIAASLGIPVDGYRACVVDPGTDASIKADTDEFHASKGGGLPTLWIGPLKLEGAVGPEALKDALDAALAHAGS